LLFIAPILVELHLRAKRRTSAVDEYLFLDEAKFPASFAADVEPSGRTAESFNCFGMVGVPDGI